MATSSEPKGNNGFIGPLLRTLMPIFVILLVVVGGLYLVKAQVRPGTSAPAGSLPSEQNGGTSEDEGGEVDVGRVLPDFSITPFQGKGPEPISQAGGNVTLINFWATWCEACMVEMPSIVKLQKAYQGRKFRVIAIDLDEKPEAVLPRTLKDLGIDFPVFLDTDNKVSELFDVHAIPLTVIIDRTRKVLFMENGERNWNSGEIRSKLDQWLAR